MTRRKRADVLLVERGLFDSRTRAQAAIAAGLVTADGAVVRKASEGLAGGGWKPPAALDLSGFAPGGDVCLDAGPSTGGFTQVLLAHGAHKVYAVDIGHGQLHARLRDDPGVVSLERTDIRTLDPACLAEP